jgi:hypothetical protein
MTDQDIAERALAKLLDGYIHLLVAPTSFCIRARPILLEAVAAARAEGKQDGIVMGERHSSDAASYVLNKCLTTPLTRREP